MDKDMKSEREWAEHMPSEGENPKYMEEQRTRGGVEEKVRDLNIGTAAARKLIQDRWRQHPLCKKQRAENFQSCYDLILEQTLVTPASIARDKQVETIYTNFGKGAE